MLVLLLVLCYLVFLIIIGVILYLWFGPVSLDTAGFLKNIICLFFFDNTVHNLFLLIIVNNNT